MCLQIAFGICCFRDTVGKGHVYGVKLVPHLVGSGVKQNLDLIAKSVRCGPLALRVKEVVVSELGPGVGKTDAVSKTKTSEFVK